MTDDHDKLNQSLAPLIARARKRVGEVLRDKWQLDVLLGVGGMEFENKFVEEKKSREYGKKAS